MLLKQLKIAEVDEVAEVLTHISHTHTPSVYYTSILGVCKVYALLALESRILKYFAAENETRIHTYIHESDEGEMTAKHPQIGRLMGCLAK